jgi:hypothetical protein
LQSAFVKSRTLYIDSTAENIETTFIHNDRENILQAAFDEIKAIQNPRFTLVVQFYEEVSCILI